MVEFRSNAKPPMVAVLACAAMLAWPSRAAENAGSIPNFSGLWARTSLGYESPQSGRGPIENRMRRPNGASNLSHLLGDYTDPILKPEAAEILRRRGEISLTGAAFPQPSNQCLPYPPPYISSNNQEIELLQEKGRVTILNMFDQQVRHVRLNAQHSAHPTASWYGESVGHYENDTLVVDTIGIKVGPLSMVDIYGTPFSAALHVVERFRLVDAETAKAFADRERAKTARWRAKTATESKSISVTRARGFSFKSRSRIRASSTHHGLGPSPIVAPRRRGPKWFAPRTPMNITAERTRRFPWLTSPISERGHVDEGFEHRGASHRGNFGDFALYWRRAGSPAPRARCLQRIGDCHLASDGITS